MNSDERYFVSQDQLRSETFKLKVAVMQREMQTAGVLDVPIDSEYLPLDREYTHEDAEDLYYDSFINTHSFITDTEEVDQIYSGPDTSNFLGKRFYTFVDMLSENFKREGDTASAITVQNLTLAGAAKYAKGRYDYYLNKFASGENHDEYADSQHAIYWSWAHVMLDHSSQLREAIPQ